MFGATARGAPFLKRSFLYFSGQIFVDFFFTSLWPQRLGAVLVTPSSLLLCFLLSFSPHLVFCLCTSCCCCRITFRAVLTTPWPRRLLLYPLSYLYQPATAPHTSAFCLLILCSCLYPVKGGGGEVVEEEDVGGWWSVTELQACPCSFQVNPSALVAAKVTAVSGSESSLCPHPLPSLPPLLHMSLEHGQGRGEERRIELRK